MVSTMRQAGYISSREQTVCLFKVLLAWIVISGCVLRTTIFFRTNRDPRGAVIHYFCVFFTVDDVALVSL